MLSLVAVLPLLGNVAKVDIRATGPVTNEGALKGMLSTAYAGAGLTVGTEHMTLYTEMPGYFVLEVSGASVSTAQLDAYWCANDPALRNGFKDLVVLGTGLSDVTDVITCVGAAGEGCVTSTPCGGGGGGGGGGDTSDPAPEPAPEPTGGGGDDDDDEGLSTTAIVLIVVGSLLIVGALLYLVWPMLSSLWKSPEPAEPMLDKKPRAPEQRVGAELPPLLTPA
mgnify:CR=1 FL=1